MHRWVRVALLTVVAVGVVTGAAFLADGTRAYVLAAIGLFLIIALGSPFALMHPRIRGMHAVVARD
jgi:uncharacterized protein (DUF58 family)